MPRFSKRTITVAGGTLVAASASLMGFLSKWEEGDRAPILVVYADKLANGLPTVCKGLTRYVTNTPIVVGEKWTVEKCEVEEQAAVLRVQTELAKCFKITPPQEVFDMGTSHAWNNGYVNTCNSLAMVAWNRGEWELGCQRLSRSDTGQYVWSYTRTGKMLPNGKPEMVFRQGLANRRADETKTCLEGLA